MYNSFALFCPKAEATVLDNPGVFASLKLYFLPGFKFQYWNIKNLELFCKYFFCSMEVSPNFQCMN